MDIQGYFTKKGLALSAKLATGALLTITRVVAGAGQTADYMAATSLPQPKQTLAVNSPTRSGNTATIPVTLAAAQAEEDYTLTELGVYAQDPDEGEILYKLYRLDTPVDIKAGSRLVLRFYLEETVSQDVNVTVNCSPEGLITEADFIPVRDKVLANGVPSRSVTLDVAELPAYLAALPRLLTENLMIHVTGTTAALISIEGFYGSGCIYISGDALGNCTIKNVFVIRDCSVGIKLFYLQFDGTGSLTDHPYNAVLLGDHIQQLSMQDCSFTGSGVGSAVVLTNASMGSLHNCTIQGFEDAICPWGGSLVVLSNVTGSGNVRGVNIYNGGIAFLAGTTEELVGGTVNYNGSGLIARAGGIL